MTLICHAFIIGLASIVPAASLRADDTWPFVARDDAFTSDALLDLRSLNEGRSGEHGFIKISADGNSFVRGDGQPIRFWAVGADGWTLKPEEMDRQCRFLAKMGVNLARLHFIIASKDDKAPINSLNEKIVEGVYRYIKAAKDNGIYVCISPWWAHHEMPDSWEIEGFKPREQLWGALFLAEKLQDAYRTWTRELYTRPNLHTGLAIKDDPTVAFLQVQNEDSLFFWTEGKFPEALKLKFGRHFHAWLVKKYGSVAAALTAWDGAKHKHDDPASGVIGVHDIFMLTKPAEGALAKRLRDQTQFMAEYQRGFYTAMGAHLRTLGCKQLLNACNWRTANDGVLKDIERWTYGALDWDAENRYVLNAHTGENAAWRAQGGHRFVSQSALRQPLALPALMRQQAGHPFMITETHWPAPNAYVAESAFLGAACQSISGVDAICWFAMHGPGWATDPRYVIWKLPGGYAQRKFVVNLPQIIGGWPANALLFRRGDLREPAPVVRETRTLDALWERKAPLVADHEYAGADDEMKRARLADGSVSRAAFLVGPVQWKAAPNASAPEITDFSSKLKDGVITSGTDEVSLDPVRGVAKIAAPRAQGVCGFLRESGGRFTLPDVTIESQNDYAVVQLVSLDALPLAQSRRVLVQALTTAQLTGWETKPATFDSKDGQSRPGEEIVKTGEPPLRIANTLVTLTLANPHLVKATRLDSGGYAAGEVAIEKQDGKLRITLPPDAMWIVLQ